MQTRSPSIPSSKIQLSLAGLFFFWPLVRLSIAKGQFTVNEQEKSFILGYCTIGTIALFFFGLLATTGVLDYLLEWRLFGLLFTFLGILVLVIVFAGVIGIFSNTSIGQFSRASSTDVLPYVPTNSLLLNYLPIVNLFRRYQQHEFSTPNMYLKESLVWRIVIGIVSFTSSVPLFCLFLILLVVRVVSLLQGIDFLPAGLHSFINKLFSKNPEEIRAYILTLFFPHKLANYQQKYTYLFAFDNFTHIKISYILGICVLIGLGILGYLQDISGLLIVGSVLFFARYLLMFLVWHHLPHLPIITELLAGIAWIADHLGKKGKTFARLLTLQ